MIRATPLLAVLLLALPAAIVRGEEGVTIPRIEIVDDNGRVRSIEEWKGTPTILAPLYTRCPLACPLITQGLKRAAAQASAPPSSYRVVLFSFDPSDTPEDLRRFRERQQVPLSWTVASTRSGDARKLLDALDYRYGQAGDYFTHPNAVIVLTPDLRYARTVFGTTYDIDAALAVARGGRDWVGQYGAWILAVLLLVCLLSVVWLFTLIGVRSAGPAES
jgi:protein SCO1